MKIVFFEINHLHSLGYRETITKEKEYLKSGFKGLSELQYSTVIRDVYKRKLPICDVAGGQIGKPWILQKGIPISKTLILESIFLNTSRMK